MTLQHMSLSQTLPAPEYANNENEKENGRKSAARGTQIVGENDVLRLQRPAESQKSPAYRQRRSWRPKSSEDYGNGGAFPEILIAQYPLDMGRRTTISSNTLAVKVDGEGKVQYDTIARQGHNEARTVHSSFKDLIPIRHLANSGQLSLQRPTEDEVVAQTQKTKEALEKLVSGAVAAQKPKNISGIKRHDPTYVRYTPAKQMGSTGDNNDRIMKIVGRQVDPFEPPKFKHKKIPRGPPSPPPPVMHSPPRKLNAEDQEAWKIPPPVSNWKNSKGYTVPLDKRLAADGRGLQDVTINDKFAQFAEALFTADRHAREEVKQRASMQQKIAAQERENKEEQLRELARKVREKTNSKSERQERDIADSSSDLSCADDRSDVENSHARRERQALRREKRIENEKQIRQSRMGAERRIQLLAKEQNRDISEKVALGMAKPSQSVETMYDSRLFNQSSGFSASFNEDQAYDKPLFAAQDAIANIYRPQASLGDDDSTTQEAGTHEYEQIVKSNRFETLGKAKSGFRDTDKSEARDGPVQFEKDTEGSRQDDDPFQIDKMIREVTAKDVKPQESGPRESQRSSKRQKVGEF